MSDMLTISAGTVGFPFQFNLGGYDLTDATAYFLVADPSGAKHSYDMTVDADNRTVQYLTTGTDLVTPGPWTYQVKVQKTSPSAVTLFTAVYPFIVEPTNDPS